MTNLEACTLRVSYTNRQGDTKNNYYDLKEIKISGENRFSVSIQRSGGGLACVMDVTRNSKSSNHVEMTHGTIHIAGLKEVYKLRKDEIVDGEHRNSIKYKRFHGRIKYEEQLELTCEILTIAKKQWTTSTYNLSVDSKRFKK